MKKTLLLRYAPIALTVLCAIAGFFMRKQQLLTELLSDGTLAQGSRMHIALGILTVVFVVGMIAMLIPQKRLTDCRCFGGGAVLNLLHMVSGLLLIAGNGMLLLREEDDMFADAGPKLSMFLQDALPVLGLLSAVCIILFALSRILGKKPSALLYMAASIYLVVRLIVRFQAWNADPSFHDYGFQLLASICCMLAAFQLAGFSFDKGKRRLTLFWSCCSTVFCAVTAADMFHSGTKDEMLVNLALTLTMLASSVQLFCAKEEEATASIEAVEAEN